MTKTPPFVVASMIKNLNIEQCELYLDGNDIYYILKERDVEIWFIWLDKLPTELDDSRKFKSFLCHPDSGYLVIHRKDGPAAVYSGGDIKEYLFMGVKHRIDGPAQINLDNKTYNFFYFGMKLTEEDFFKQLCQSERIEFLFNRDEYT